MNKPYRICFVCTGNICRSAVADVLMRDLIAQRGLTAQVQVDSAGTGSWHQGEPADPRGLALLTQAGLDGSQHRARRIEAHWLEQRDLIIALDRSHLRDLQRLAHQAEASTPIYLLRSFERAVEQSQPPSPEGGQADVTDPYYEADHVFAEVFAQVRTCCEHLLDWVQRSQLPTAQAR